MQMKMLIRRGIGIALLILLIGIGITFVVNNHFHARRTGVFSHVNYERVQPGMTLEEVKSLLGPDGIETKSVPEIVDWDQPVDSPKRLKAVISAEKILRWDDGYRYILIGFQEGKVSEKWYWEPSL